MLNFPIAYFNSNDGSSLLGFGSSSFFELKETADFTSINEFIQQNKSKYIFCAFSFDLKNRFEHLSSTNKDDICFPELVLFTTEFVVEIFNNKATNFLQGIENDFSKSFIFEFFKNVNTTTKFDFKFEPTTTKEVYLNQLDSLKSHIKRGDIYEINYCQEFIDKNAYVQNDFELYWKLNQITKAPYSSYLSFNEFSVFCGSPELYISKKDSKLISKPIKGTSRRGKDSEEDLFLIQSLQHDPKERAENIMVVDLVRNDLSRLALKNSVKVEELCGIHTFETVHQMISTVSCEIDPQTPFSEILKTTFPMGSMTGVPKIRALELIEEHEDFKRGLYSGSIGFIHPNGDFDLNVVIRSLIHNKKKNTLSCAVGGAITDLSIPENEYEECFVKVKRILNALNE